MQMRIKVLLHIYKVKYLKIQQTKQCLNTLGLLQARQTYTAKCK